MFWLRPFYYVYMKKLLTILLILFFCISSASLVEAKKPVKKKIHKKIIVKTKSSKKTKTTKKVDKFILQRKKLAAQAKKQIVTPDIYTPPATIDYPAVTIEVPAKDTSTLTKAAGKSRPSYVLSPKLAFFSGDYSGLAVGAEFDITNQTGVVVAADGLYKLEGNSVSWIQIGGIAKYIIPMEGQTFKPYVGGGMNYNIYTISGLSDTANGVGIKVFAGADFPISGSGTFFGTLGFASQSFSYTANVLGLSQTFSASGSGIYLETGYRLVL